MGLFWDFLKFGLPTVGAVGLGAWAYRRGWKPVPIGLAAIGGWGGGYLVYWGASRVATHIEGLPSKVVVPQLGQFSGAPVGQPGNALPSALPQDPRNASPYWDVRPGSRYTNEARGKDGQPPDNAVVIDMATRQPVQAPQAPPGQPAATPMPGSTAPAGPGMGFIGPKPYDPGDSFGGGGSQGGI